jgi:hypothetical protein
MPLTKAQIKRAARLYSLAVVAHANAAAASDEDGALVMDAARTAACDAIERLGHEAGDLLTLEACLTAARAKP